ncbi:hypothetical protein AgCh_013480 [Apium graveolens]
MSSVNSEKWHSAMKSEMESMYTNQVWTLVEAPEGVKPIGCKWILLAIAAYYDYEIWQMDVKTAFLNGKLEEEVYMTQPEGFLSKGNEHLVYEPCVYKKVSGSTVTFLVLYVDDILLIGNDIPMLQSIKVWLSKNFTMKDLGEASYILGMKIYRDRSRRMIGLTQGTYIQKVLKRFSMENSKRGLIPMSHGVSLSEKMSPKTPEERERMSKIPYASAIGSIMYAMLCTRPDVAYSISVTSRYQFNPVENRGDVNVKRVDTHNNVADPLTKPLSQSHFDRHKDKMVKTECYVVNVVKEVNDLAFEVEAEIDENSSFTRNYGRRRCKREEYMIKEEIKGVLDLSLEIQGLKESVEKMHLPQGLSL